MSDSPAPAAPAKPASKLSCFPCLVLLLLAGLGGAGITLGLFQFLKSSIPYKDGLARAQADPRVREALGEPVQGGWWVNGSLSDRGNHGTATLVIPLEGPRGSATLQLAASKSGGLWTTGRAVVSLEPSGETLNLLEQQAPAPPGDEAR